MEKIELKDAFAEFKNQKNIDRPTMMGVLEDVFRTQITKTYGSADNLDIIINIDKGDCEIYWNREVVEEVEDPNTQIALEELEDDDYEVGDFLKEDRAQGLRTQRNSQYPSESPGSHHGHREGQPL